MIKGTIRLFNGHGLELKKAVYLSKMGRDRIIERWRNNNSSTFTLDKDAYLEIAPNARPQKVRKDGTNIQRRVLSKKESSIERPKAVYDNTDYTAKYLDSVIN